MAFIAQALNDAFEQSQGPFAIEDPIGAGDVRRFEAETFVGTLPVQRQVLRAAAALLPLLFVPLVGEKMFQRGQEKRAKLSAFGA